MTHTSQNLWVLGKLVFLDNPCKQQHLSPENLGSKQHMSFPSTSYPLDKAPVPCQIFCLCLFELLQQNTLDWVTYKTIEISFSQSGDWKFKIKGPGRPGSGGTLSKGLHMVEGISVRFPYKSINYIHEGSILMTKLHPKILPLNLNPLVSGLQHGDFAGTHTSRYSPL